MSRSSFHRLGPAALFVVLWSTGFIGAKAGIAHASPLTFLLLRFGLVLALMLPIALLWKAPWPRGAMIIHVAVIGLLIQAVYLGGVYVGMSRGVTAGLSGLIAGAQPLLTAGLSAGTGGERIARLKWTGLAIGFAGIALVVGERVGFAGVDPIGVALCVVSVVGIAVGTLYQKRYAGGVDLRTGAVIQYGASALLMLLLAPLTEDMHVEWAPQFIFALSWLVVVLSIGAVSLYFVLIRRGAAVDVASLFYLVPPTVALMGYVLFGETLSAAAILGMVLASIGVALVNRKPAPTNDAATSRAAQ